jgi:hypothetical protein
MCKLGKERPDASDFVYTKMRLWSALRISCVNNTSAELQSRLHCVSWCKSRNYRCLDRSQRESIQSLLFIVPRTVRQAEVIKFSTWTFEQSISGCSTLFDISTSIYRSSDCLSIMTGSLSTMVSPTICTIVPSENNFVTAMSGLCFDVRGPCFLYYCAISRV